MANPMGLYYLFASLMLIVSAYSLALLVVSVVAHRLSGWDVDVAHFFMGVSMAGMFIVDWAFGPRQMWEVIFAVLLVWFLLCGALSMQRYGLHLSHYLIHAVMSLAMLLMYAFPRGANGAMSGMSMSMQSGSRLDPGLACLLALAILASAIFTLASAKKGASHHGSHPPVFSVTGAQRAGGPELVGIEGYIATPWLEDASHVVMCIGMGFLLILMT